MLGFLAAVILSFVPGILYAAVLYRFDRFEKEPIWLVAGSFLWGAIAATTGAIIWSTILQGSVQALTGDEELAAVTGATLIAPVAEEITKGCAVLMVFWIFRREFDSVLDGVIYGGMAGLGFAATENVLYLYFKGFAEGGAAGLFTLFFLRVVLLGWGHAVYSACFGAGLALARLNRQKWGKIVAPAAGLALAIAIHALHNTLTVVLTERFGLGGLAVTLAVAWLGWGFMLVVVGLAIARERRWMREFLPEEVALGNLTPAQLTTACSLRQRLIERLRFRGTSRLYSTAGELAIRKRHVARLGDEGGNLADIDRLRSELRQLSSRFG